MGMIDGQDRTMPDDSIWCAAAEADAEDAWLSACAGLQVAIDESPDRAASVVRVAQEFPSLDEADGLQPWSPRRLDQWMLAGGRCSASGHWAAMLALSLWEGTAGQFPFSDAWVGWDDADRHAVERVCRSVANLGSGIGRGEERRE